MGGGLSDDANWWVLLSGSSLPGPTHLLCPRCPWSLCMIDTSRSWSLGICWEQHCQSLSQSLSFQTLLLCPVCARQKFCLAGSSISLIVWTSASGPHLCGPCQHPLCLSFPVAGRQCHHCCQNHHCCGMTASTSLINLIINLLLCHWSPLLCWKILASALLCPHSSQKQPWTLCTSDFLELSTP